MVDVRIKLRGDAVADVADVDDIYGVDAVDAVVGCVD